MVDTPLRDIQPSADVQQEIKSRYHPRCVVCSPTNPRGLHLDVQVNAEGVLIGSFTLDRSAEGYTGLSHGGVIAAVLDGAMGNWLFAHDIVTVTIELNVKYRYPLKLEELARQLYDKVEVIADFTSEGQFGKSTFAGEDILALLQRRPCSVDDIAGGLGMHHQAMIKTMTQLTRNGYVEVKPQKGKLFYTLMRDRGGEDC